MQARSVHTTLENPHVKEHSHKPSHVESLPKKLHKNTKIVIRKDPSQRPVK